MIAGRISPWVTPLKVMIYLAWICGGTVISSSAMAQGRAADPGSVVPGAAGTAEPHALSTGPASAQELALRTSLAQTAVVISRSGSALELLYPIRLAFVADGTDLLAPATVMLDLLVHSLREYEHSNIAVSVYTDAIGSSLYNQQQSQSRADAVVAYLVAKGISPERLVAKGVGETAPLEAPNTPEGRDLNRRLQVTITPLS
jgi:outer membrane protein OmpA-like peptidoglycan-associated protein